MFPDHFLHLHYFCIFNIINSCKLILLLQFPFLLLFCLFNFFFCFSHSFFSLVRFFRFLVSSLFLRLFCFFFCFFSFSSVSSVSRIPLSSSRPDSSSSVSTLLFLQAVKPNAIVKHSVSINSLIALFCFFVFSFYLLFYLAIFLLIIFILIVCWK